MTTILIPKKATASITRSLVLADSWGKLTRYDITSQRSDGTKQQYTREVYDHGHGAAILLYNSDEKTVVLISQLRIPVFLQGHPYELVEVCAGLLDARDPVEAIKKEAEEETGFKIDEVTPVGEVFMCPGSVTERLHLFIAPVTHDMKVHQGGGLKEEGEDIHVFSIPISEALNMIDDGRIIDAKTIILIQHVVLKGICTP